MSSGRHRVLSTQSFVGLQYGYIIIPMDVDRERFIEQCYRWERVSILVEQGGGVVHECYIVKSVLQEVEFPSESNKLGSCVVFLTDLFSAHPVILGVLSKEDESQLLSEGTFKLSRNYEGSVVTVQGDAKKGVINLSVSGGSVSQLNILVSNEDETASINIRSNGNVNIEAKDTFKVNKGSEAMVKGDELQTQLDKNNTYLSNLKLAIEAALDILDAAVPAASKAAFEAVLVGQSPGDYSDIKSEESFLD